MITQLDDKQVGELIGRTIVQTDYLPSALLVEKTPNGLSDYMIPGKSEIVLFKCKRGIKINLADVKVNDLNFVLEDNSIKRIIVQELRHRYSHPKPNLFLILGMILFVFGMDALFNRLNLGYFSLIIGLLLGLVSSLFRNSGNKLSITIEFESTTGIETLILSANRKSIVDDFFKRYYSSKLFQ
jgi:hypothetical protein